MKKMKILSLLLATTLVSANLIGCSSNNNTTQQVQQAEYPGTPSPDVAISDQTSEVLTDYNPTKQDLDLNTRIFTNYGFSVATKDTIEAQSILVLKGIAPPVNYEEIIKQELVNLIDDEYFNQVSPIKSIDTTDYHYSYKIATQYIMTQLKILTNSRPDLLTFDNIESFIENNIEVIQENAENSNITKATIKVKDDGNEEIRAYFENTYEIYSIPYKSDPTSNERFEVLYLQANDENLAEQRLQEVEFIADTFILDTDSVELNENNKSKFASVSFTSYLNQEYFPNELLIPYSKTSHFEDFDILDSLEISLSSTDAILTVFFADYHHLENLEEYVTTQVNENTFEILTKPVDVTNDDGSVTQEELILSIIHSSEELGEFKTYIELNDKNGELDFSTLKYTKADVDMINEIFNDIMENYQVKLNNSAQAYMDMINEMNQAFSME